MGITFLQQTTPVTRIGIELRSLSDNARSDATKIGDRLQTYPERLGPPRFVAVHRRAERCISSASSHAERQCEVLLPTEIVRAVRREDAASSTCRIHHHQNRLQSTVVGTGSTTSTSAPRSTTSSSSIAHATLHRDAVQVFLSWRAFPPRGRPIGRPSRARMANSGDSKRSTELLASAAATAAATTRPMER